jgi:MFS family permease
MKIDLAGPKNRGLAMGLNEFAGYFAVAASALATGYVASVFGLRPQPFYLGVGFVGIGALLSVFLVRETREHVAHEAKLDGGPIPSVLPTQREIFVQTSFADRNLSSVSQAGLVNNLNDGMAWGLFPIFFAAAGLGLSQIGWLAAIYPAVWGVAQLFTGALSDTVGRKRLIVLVVIGDVAHPSWRASAVGVYRLWRDLGYAIGAVLAGVVADAFGIGTSIGMVAAVTFSSGLLAAIRMQETLVRPTATPTPEDA